MSENVDLLGAPSERGVWLIAAALLALGVAVLTAALTGVLGSSTSSAPAPPAILAAARTPSAPEGAARARVAGRGASSAAGPYADGAAVRPAVQAAAVSGVGGASGGRRVLAVAVSAPAEHIRAAWEAGFYPIYSEAQRVFGVNWLLLASIHMQETAFSTARSTYRGLNFAGCCGGPMQFNVTNGPVTTWASVRDAYRYGRRPAVYDHRTARHPSIYDDFDAVMAAAWLLSSDGARASLDDSAWWAAYDYYGHDATGVSYADEVLARAIGWSQHGFCINCGVSQSLVAAVHAAYGAPVLETFVAARVARAARARRRGHRRR